MKRYAILTWVTTLALLLAQLSPTIVALATVASTQCFTVSPGQAATLTYDSATLEIGATAVIATTNICITSLDQDSMTAIDKGMTDVTMGQRKGYRFTPHGMHFNAKIKVRLPYDPTLIPAGMSEQDLKTYYFDDQLGMWQELDRVAVDTTAKMIISLTDHFTDMINATITVPDHPGALSYNPTSIKDIKAADPGARINLIAPPQANNAGDARLSYPIEVPPGRSGMQPDLAVTYNSSGGNGWLGLGWDLAAPSITVDTRWGVPRYDAAKETETYLLNGNELTPLAHRGEPQPRSGDSTNGKQFHMRVEGAFQKIIRYGDAPDNYRWEVIDKSGTVFLYGAATAGDPDGEPSLRDSSGHIFKWMLREVRDLNGNGMAYSYAHVADTGIDGGNVPGVQIYLKTINYTLAPGKSGPFTITFVRDRDIAPFERRPDVVIDARGGFKMVTADRLVRIEVRLNEAGQDKLVRSYDFAYQQGAFQKTLLKSITQFGDDGKTALPAHTFTYYPDTLAFAQPVSWQTGQDNVKAGLLKQDQASALSGAISSSVGGHLYIGFNVTSPTKSMSAGAKVGFNLSATEGALALIDLDGDGLPDKVFCSAWNVLHTTCTQFKFRRNLSGPGGGAVFSDPPVVLQTLSAISRENSATVSFGVEGYLSADGFGVSALANTATTFTMGTTYFSDVNGDGLPDLVDDGHVWFNHLVGNTPTFVRDDSGATPAPIGGNASATGGVRSNGLIGADESLRQQNIDDFPLHDTLRIWEAPFSGTIRIAGSVALKETQTPERSSYQAADGVRVAIQQNATELWSTTIAADDYSAQQPAGVEALAVQAGDNIYFRVQSVADGRFDQVAWDPQIDYLDDQGQPQIVSDANLLNPYHYRASEDFTLAGRPDTSITAPMNGTVKLAGSLTKLGVTSDGLTVVVLQNDTTAFSQAIGRDETGDIALSAEIPVQQNDILKLRILANSAIDLSRIRWAPNLAYSASDDPSLPLVDEHGTPVYQLHPAYDIETYPLAQTDGATLAPGVQESWTAPTTGTLTVRPTLASSSSATNGQVFLTVKRAGTLVASQPISIIQGQAPSAPLTFDVVEGDQLFFDYAARNPRLGGQLSDKYVEVTYDPSDDSAWVRVPSAFRSAADVALLTNQGRYPLFPIAYRGWSSIGYNGNRDLAAQPIVEARLSTNLDPASRVQEYDATNDIWLRLPSLPTSRAGLGVVAGADGKLYAIGGHLAPNPGSPKDSTKPDEDDRYRTTALGTVEAYDPATYTWATRAALPTKRSELGVAAANGKLYVIGGTSGRNILGIPSVSNVVEEYDPASDSWRRRAPMPTARTGLAVATAANGKLYAVGGEGTLFGPVKTVEEYDPIANTWRRRTDMPTARRWLTLVAGANGKLYAIGGDDGQHELATVEEYDPAANTWTTRAAMPTARLGLTSAAQGDLIYVIGGRNKDTGALSSVETYNVVTNEWGAIAGLSIPRALLGAAIAANGKLYALGGSNRDYRGTPTAYVFNPAPDRGYTWRGPSDDGWVGSDGSSSSRLGKPALDEQVTADQLTKDATGQTVRAVKRLSRTSQFAAQGGLNLGGPISISGGISAGTSLSVVDYLDMNGDRFPDVVGNGRVQFSTPQGTLEGKNDPVPGLGRSRETNNLAWNAGIGGTPPFGSGNSRARQQPPGENKTGTQMVPLSLNGSLGGGMVDSSYDLLDVNGDGLPDRVTKAGAQLLVALNLGYSFAAPETWGAAAINIGASETASVGGSLGLNIDNYAYAGGLSLNKNKSLTKQTLLDVNGDGLLDVVNTYGDTLGVLINSGGGFGDGRQLAWQVSSAQNVCVGHDEAKVLPSTSGIDWTKAHICDGNTGQGGGVYVTIPIGPLCGGACYIIINPGGDVSQNMSRQEAMLRDVDGDGYADYVMSTADNAMTVALNLAGRTNLLQSVARPLGGKIDLEYQRSGNTRDMPSSRWVPSKVGTFDGVAGDGVDTQVTTYRYDQGVYNRLEREFYGYGTVTEEQRDGANGGVVYRTLLREYRTDSFYTKGLLKRMLTQNAAGKPFTETENSYRLIDIQTGADANPQSTAATVFPQLSRTDQRFYEGGAAAGKTTYTSFLYDALGNVTQFFDAGDAGAADDVTAIIGYSACTGSYVVGKPNKIVVTVGGAEMRHREASVDCINGNVTQIREYLDDAHVAVTDLGYFPSGLLKTIAGPPNSNTPAQRYTLTYDYDAVIGTYVTSIADSYGYASAATYNVKFGQPLSATDINGNTTSYAYDTFGRTTGITGPYEQGGTTATISFDYHPEAPVPYALAHHLDRFRNPDNPIDTVLFTDGLKRVIQTKKDATLFTGPDSVAADGMIVSGRVVFDAFGRTVKQFYPVTEPTGAAGTFNRAYDTVQPTLNAFDILDRTVKVTLPDNTFTESAYGFGADRSGTQQFLTTVTDANGKQKKIYNDVREQITGVQEFNKLPSGTTQVIWTSFAYDPLQQLVQVNDDKNNVTRITYDNLGRRTSVDNPDTGKTEMVYDLASNMVAEITANLRAQGKRIAYSYHFNRVTAITYPNFPGNNVTYTYGDAGAADNRAGRITRVTDESGAEERFYGKLGEIVKEIKTVATDTGAAPGVYTTQYLYDTFGRLQQMTYPDGEVLTYRYDAGGLVNQATGAKAGAAYSYVKRLEYDKFEQRAFLIEGNNVRTQYTYRSDNRLLQNMQAGLPGAPTFQNLSYTYDKVGNILNLKNDVAAPTASQMGGPTSQTFQYDDLYRLTSASGTYQFMPNKTRKYSLSMSYDTIHNILSKQQTDQIVQPSGNPVTQQKTTYNWTYAYGGAQPHATTHLGDRTFTYDANGNQAGWTNDRNGTRRNIVWDDENRIQSIFDNGHQKTYKYDDQGQRVLKRGPQGETAYVNQYFTIRNRTVGTKHVYVGTTRLASKMMKPDGIFEADQYYFHPDHLGSSNYVTDASGALFEHLEYFPFGETWVEESSNTQRTPYLFTSKELDEETDLYYYGARYYDPRTSQFISAEPLLTSKPDKLPQHSELLGAFTYANNNPLAYVDPDGRDALIVVGYAKGAKDRAAELAASNTLKAEIANAGVKVTVVDLHGARSKAEALGRLSTATSSTANAPKSVVVITHGAPGKMAVAKEGEKIKFATSEEIADAAHIREGGALCIIACQVGKNPDAAKASGGVRVFAPNKRLTLYEDSTGQGTVGPHDRSEPDTTPGAFTLPGTNQTILESVLEAEQGASKQRDRSLPSKEKVDIKLEQ